MGKEVAVLLTCYNRKAQTIACLGSLFEATIPEDLHLDIYLTDDGSTDGTGDAVKELYPRITLLKGSETCFGRRYAVGMDNRLADKTVRCVPVDKRRCQATT